MIQICNYDVFESEAQTIVNTINCVGVMGKGIALEYKKRYPEMFIRYKELCDKHLIKIGSLWLYKALEYPNKWILNFPTKDHWKNPSKLEYLEKGLQKFVDTYKSKGITSISFPLLGASNGKIPKDVSFNTMFKYLNGLDIPVLIHTYEK